MANKDNKEPAYKDPSLPIEERAADLISRMTLKEKAAQMVHPAADIPRLGVLEYNWWNEASPAPGSRRSFRRR
jgi:beta-glucosidase